MFKKMQRMVTGFCLGIALLTSQGCIPLIVGAAVGAGGFAFIQGNLQQNLDNSVEEVYKASLKAFDKEKIEVLEKNSDEHKAVIYGRLVDDKRIKITIQALTEQASNIKIRVGMLGDESRSIEILETIKKVL